MLLTKKQFEYLQRELEHAEGRVRSENPDFVSGFHAISMQAELVDCTLARFEDFKGKLNNAELLLIFHISTLRDTNPDLTPKGTAHTKRMIADSLYWETLGPAIKAMPGYIMPEGTMPEGVMAESVMPGDVMPMDLVPENVMSEDRDTAGLENGEDGDDVESEYAYDGDDNKLEKFIKQMINKDHKAEFERHDATLRSKLTGVKKMTDMINKYIDDLTESQTLLVHLESIAHKWTSCILEAEDIEPLSRAQQVVVDAAIKVKHSQEILDVLPMDFTPFCNVEDPGRGKKLYKGIVWDCEGGEESDDSDTSEPKKLKRGRKKKPASTGPKIITRFSVDEAMANKIKQDARNAALKAMKEETARLKAMDEAKGGKKGKRAGSPAPKRKRARRSY